MPIFMKRPVCAYGKDAVASWEREHPLMPAAGAWPERSGAVWLCWALWEGVSGRHQELHFGS